MVLLWRDQVGESYKARVGQRQCLESRQWVLEMEEWGTPPWNGNPPPGHPEARALADSLNREREEGKERYRERAKSCFKASASPLVAALVVFSSVFVSLSQDPIRHHRDAQ